MSQSMLQAAATLNQLQQKMDVIGSNLSNSQTTGYKQRQSEFSSLLFQQINNMTRETGTDNRSTPSGVRIGTGAALDSPQLEFSQGAIKETDRALDTSLLKDNHLFEVAVTRDGATETQYTRDGGFYLSEAGEGNTLMLTTQNGDQVMGVNGPITIMPDFDDVAISPEGNVTVERAGQTQTAGTLNIVMSSRPDLLETVGSNMFRLPDDGELAYNQNDVMQTVAPEGDLLKSGALEQSNVDLSKQMTDLLTTQRAYQFNARTISMSDEMSGLINQLR